jgi:hypothetical protein
MSVPSPIAIKERTLYKVRFGPILLQKSAMTGGGA